MTLHELSCVNRTAKTCANCTAAPSCAYAVLLEPSGKGIPELGITDRAPPPLVLSPEAPVVDGNPIDLRKGHHLDVRVVLLGPARALSDLLVAALRVGARGGVGKRSHEGTRVPLTAVDVHAEPVVCAPPSTTAILETISPLRLTHEGKVRARFGAREFLLGLARRADTLSRLYGSEPLGPEPSTEGLTLQTKSARVVHVERWSARQKARMDLPGVIGTFELRGDVEPWWPWLALGEWVQVGKGTSMGFGRYRLWGASRDQTPRTPTDP
jgi:CRISPR-associated endoribonuclease Cas6